MNQSQGGAATRRFLYAAFLGFVLASLAPQAARAQNIVKHREQTTVSKAALLSLVRNSLRGSESAEISLRYQSRLLQFRLEPVQVLAPSAKIFSVTDDGEREEPVLVQHYKGTSPEGDTIRLSLRGDEQDLWLNALADLGDKRVSYKSVRSTEQELELEAEEQDPEAVAKLLESCGVEDAAGIAQSAFAASTPPVEAVETVLYRAASLATEADYEWTSAVGSAVDTNAEIQAIINQVNGLTEPQLGIRFFITHQRAYLTSNDPYNGNGEEMLVELGDRLANTQTHGTFYDYAQLFTGRDIINNGNSAVIGLAHAGACCSSAAASVVERRSGEGMRNVSAHELSHLLGAEHDTSGSYIMSPYANTSDYYSPESISAIQARQLYNDNLQNVTRLNVGPRVPRSLVMWGDSLYWGSPDGGAIAEYYELFKSSNSGDACSGVPYITPVGGEWARDRAAVLGVPAYYSVQAVNDRGPGPCLGPLMPAAPSAPSSFNISDVSTPTNLKLRLSWSGNEAGYQLFRSTSPSATPCSGSPLAALLGVRFYEDTAVVQGTRYYYSLRAVELSSPPGECSPIISLSPPSGNISGRVNSMTSSAVELSWFSPYEAQRLLIKRALVTTPAAYSTIARLPSSDRLYTDTSINPDGTNYFYQIDACNVSGCVSSQPIEGSALVLPLEPRNLSASQGIGSQIEISWSPPLRGAAEYYRVLLSRTGASGPYSIISPTFLSARSAAYTPSSEGDADLYFKVVAVNDAGTGAESAAASGWAFRSPRPFAASNGYFPDKIGLSWTAARGATSYRISRSVVATGVVLSDIVISSGATTSYEDRNVPADTAVAYSIVALRDQLVSSPASIATGRRNSAQQSTVGGTAASFGTIPNFVELTWNALSVTPAQYGIFRAATATGVCTSGTRIAGPSGSSTTLRYYDSSAVPGATYYYAIRGEYDGGFVTDCAPGVAGFRPLPAPASVQASQDQTTGVSVTWSAVPQATSYNIYRTTDLSACGGSPIRTTTGTSIVDSMAVPGQLYRYGVAAIGANGLPGICETAYGRRVHSSSSSSSSVGSSQSSSSQSSFSSSAATSSQSSSLTSSQSSSSVASSTSSAPTSQSSSLSSIPSSASSSRSSQSSAQSSSSFSSLSQSSSTASSVVSSASSTSAAQSSVSSSRSSSFSSSSDSIASSASSSSAPLMPAPQLRRKRGSNVLTVRLPSAVVGNVEVVLVRVKRNGAERVLKVEHAKSKRVRIVIKKAGNYTIFYRVLPSGSATASSVSERASIRFRLV